MLRVTRQGPEAVHFVSSPLEVGQEVQVKVDWERRFDHMQQHSGKDHKTNGQHHCRSCSLWSETDHQTEL